jgi:opacity protein-like surface antigen
MKRFVRVATVWLAWSLCIGAVSAKAQTTASSGSDPRFYAELNGGPTLGHKSDTFLGGEAGLRLVAGLDIFVEGGHMGNVGTSQLDSAAAKIADYLGATVSTAKKVNYVDGGIRYHVHAIPVVHPYVLVGVGLADVKTEATFAVGGTTLTSADLANRGVQLGGDLSGSSRKTLVVGGVGVNVPFLKHLFVDIGYRYGRVFPKTGEVETDTSLNTQRVVVGIGITF